MQQTEFDGYAESYEDLHRRNIAISGETSEYFAEYKVAFAAELTKFSKTAEISVLDFGCGIGNSIPWFRKYFPGIKLVCADVSSKSLEYASKRFPGDEQYLNVAEDRLNVPDNSFDLVFSACVFHHIAPHERQLWLKELYRVAKPNALLSIFEHNPWNPLTVRAVKDCPFDEGVELINSIQMRSMISVAGWQKAKIYFRIFFPHVLAFMRPLEKGLKWLPLGAQYAAFAVKPDR